jgi:hypothetical protein
MSTPITPTAPPASTPLPSESNQDQHSNQPAPTSGESSNTVDADEDRKRSRTGNNTAHDRRDGRDGRNKRTKRSPPPRPEGWTRANDRAKMKSSINEEDAFNAMSGATVEQGGDVQVEEKGKRLPKRKCAVLIGSVAPLFFFTDGQLTGVGIAEPDTLVCRCKSFCSPECNVC